MKKTTLRSEIFTVYVKKAATFSGGLSFYIGIAKILILFDLFSNFLDWVADIIPTSADPFQPDPFWPIPMSARPHIGRTPKPHSPTAPQPHNSTLTWSTFNLISINYAHLWLHTLNVVEGWMWIGKKYSINNLIPFSLIMVQETFPPLIHFPSYPFMDFQNPTSYYFLGLSHS